MIGIRARDQRNEDFTELEAREKTRLTEIGDEQGGELIFATYETKDRKRTKAQDL